MDRLPGHARAKRFQAERERGECPSSVPVLPQRAGTSPGFLPFDQGEARDQGSNGAQSVPMGRFIRVSRLLGGPPRFRIGLVLFVPSGGWARHVRLTSENSPSCNLD